MILIYVIFLYIPYSHKILHGILALILGKQMHKMDDLSSVDCLVFESGSSKNIYNNKFSYRIILRICG
jgi:hypothetical protein